MPLENSQTMLVVLLVIGLAVGAGAGYFMGPGGDDNSEHWYDSGYDAGFITGQTSAVIPWGSDPPDDFSNTDIRDLKDDVSGLYTLVYGAIGASLIAALAAIVSLMQTSRQLAG